MPHGGRTLQSNLLLTLGGLCYTQCKDVRPMDF